MQEQAREFPPDAEREYADYLSYCMELAARKYSDHPDVEALVQDTVLTLLERQRRGEKVEYPKGFLSAVMKNLYGGYLRRKYREKIVFYPFGYGQTSTGEEDDPGESPFEDVFSEEGTHDCRDEAYAAVRRELGRLIRIYREVAVRHYVYGQSVERIAADLHIPVGTVKSRLSAARVRMKEGISKMEKYDKVSYAPKGVRIGIWGCGSFKNEPFSLLSSEIEGNILYVAYEKPLPIDKIAEIMGIPAAYIEQLVIRLTEGELMGHTDGGLYYTRCFLQAHKDSFGDIPAEEALAARLAPAVWERVRQVLEPLLTGETVSTMSEKQKATLVLFLLHDALTSLVLEQNPTLSEDFPLPERPNGGKWLATGTVYEPDETDSKYDGSGPVQITVEDGRRDHRAVLYDMQSAFGDGHWAYSRLDTASSLQDIARLYASFLGIDIEPQNKELYQKIPFFEELHILRRNEKGKAELDIPAIPLDEWNKDWKDAKETLKNALRPLACEELARPQSARKNRVPKYVDGRDHYLYTGALDAYPKAQMFAIVEQGLLPWRVEIGKTPMILMVYK